MICAPLGTWVFYGSACVIELCIGWFLGTILYKGTRNGPKGDVWRWSSEDSRDTWIDVVKSMITASGIAAALLASLSLGRPTIALSPIVTRSVKSASVLLVLCVCVSMVAILVLARGHETAKASFVTEEREAKRPTEGIREGLLEIPTFGLLLFAGFVALSGFFVGFLFLARIVWHI
jgi:hypothetical protein